MEEHFKCLLLSFPDARTLYHDTSLCGEMAWESYLLACLSTSRTCPSICSAVSTWRTHWTNRAKACRNATDNQFLFRLGDQRAAPPPACRILSSLYSCRLLTYVPQTGMVCLINSYISVRLQLDQTLPHHLIEDLKIIQPVKSQLA